VGRGAYTQKDSTVKTTTWQELACMHMDLPREVARRRFRRYGRLQQELESEGLVWLVHYAKMYRPEQCPGAKARSFLVQRLHWAMQRYLKNREWKWNEAQSMDGGGEGGGGVAFAGVWQTRELRPEGEAVFREELAARGLAADG
jgi:hypothetical protein